jgi:type II secretory ATPase GspE/PulE/Tfp pilus assembly ATPase PilB-like protein
MPHTHYCSRCKTAIYTCHEVVLRDDSNAWCGNSGPFHTPEYCDDCCDALAETEDNVNEAMHADDETAAQVWVEGR